MGGNTEKQGGQKKQLPEITRSGMASNQRRQTPSLANWLISRLILRRLHEEFFGDLEEIYRERISAKGKLYATLIYWIDALHLLMGFTSFNLFKNQNNLTIMNKHYLLVATRNLLRNKTYAFINVLSLAVGMGVCLTICQYIYFELSYDKFHGNFQNIYHLEMEEVKNGVHSKRPFTGYSFGPNAREEIPEIEQYIRIHKFAINTIVTSPDDNKSFHEDGHDLLFADKAFFEVFNFPFKLGSKESAFDEIYNIVITEKTADKYFGTTNPIGKTLTVNTQPSPGNYTVSGVLEELPVNSSLQFEFLMPIENYLELAWGGAVKKNSNGWVDWESFMTCFIVEESANLRLVHEKLDQLINRHRGQRNAHLNINEKAVLQPIANIHLKSDAGADAGYIVGKGNILYIQVFAIVAFFILVIAWVNYINLSTAYSLRRAKEVGIRKSIGAFRRQLISQFLIESILINTLSALLAVGVAYLALPVLSQIIGKELILNVLGIPMFWVWFSAIIITGSFLSGLYPAFALSAFKPISMLGANKTGLTGKISVRSGLIAFQFLTSLLLISGTYLVHKQIMFMKDQEMGMETEKILVLKGPEVNLGPNHQSTFQTFKDKVVSHNAISSVAGSVLIPGQINNTGIDNIRKSDEHAEVGQYGRGILVDPDFPETYGFEFLAGGPFTEDMSSPESTVIINEEAVRAYGLGSPENAIRQRLIISNDDINQFEIIGVVKNFHWHSLRDAHTPYLFGYERDAHSYISFNMNLSNIQESLAYIEKTYKSFFPGNPFHYFFLEDEFNRQYQADMQFGNLFLALTMLAIFIACTGLFALVSYSAALRVKEIGIRKVLGASTGNLMMLLSKEYLKLLLVAIALAAPVVLYWGGAWLDNYAFRTNLGIELFLIPGLIITLISLLTVSHRTFSAANADPVESLRKE